MTRLEELNQAVDDAIAARRDYLDAEMARASELQVGDDIYNLDTGVRVGTVTKLYRYWRDRDCGVRDRSLSCEYEYETLPHSFDNTSRQVGCRFGTKAQALAAAEERYRRALDDLG